MAKQYVRMKIQGMAVQHGAFNRQSPVQNHDGLGLSEGLTEGLTLGLLVGLLLGLSEGITLGLVEGS